MIKSIINYFTLFFSKPGLQRQFEDMLEQAESIVEEQKEEVKPEVEPKVKKPRKPRAKKA